MKRSLIVLFLLGFAAATPATDLLDAGDYAKSYDTAMTASDDLTAAQAALAMLFYRTPGDRAWIDRAVNAARQSVQENPNNAVAYRVLAGALGMRADISGLSWSAFQLSRETRADLEKSLALNPNYADGRMALARWHAGAYAKAGRISGGNPEYARKLAIQAINDAPQNVWVHWQAGLVFTDLREPKNVRAVLEHALDITPKNAQDKDAQAQAKALLAKLK